MPWRCGMMLRLQFNNRVALSSCNRQVYKNPNTDEVVETKGGNHKVLKAWREQYGVEAVDSWLQ